MEKLKRCDNTFQDEIKAVKFVTADNEYRQIYYDICRLVAYEYVMLWAILS